MTEKIAHTPGPWHTFRSGPNPWWIVRAGARDVADVEPKGDTCVWNDPKHAGVVEANARLIAAAPDLLALVRQLASECANCGGEGYRIVTFNADAVERDACPDCADIRAVIAKAEGRS